MAKDVTCRVNNCKYYTMGDSCTASCIEVTTDKSSCGCSTSCETNCKTFQAK